MRQISEDRHTKEDGPKEEFQDNLYYQVQKKYQDICQEGCTTLCWYYRPGYTYYLNSPDSGARNQIRFWFGFYLDEWLWDYGYVEQCYLGLFPASQ